jgi:Rrf2 family protein
VRISAKGEYALKAMLDLSLQPWRRTVPIQEIAARQAIPQRYLEQVLQSLKHAELLASRRGAAGGYQLTRRPEEVTVGDVLRAVEGVRTTLGMRNGRGQRTPDLAELWEEIDRAVSQVVDRLTFGELAERARARTGSQAMYHI